MDEDSICIVFYFNEGEAGKPWEKQKRNSFLDLMRAKNKIVDTKVGFLKSFVLACAEEEVELS